MYINNYIVSLTVTVNIVNMYTLQLFVHFCIQIWKIRRFVSTTWPPYMRELAIDTADHG
jgi:hypothetical protein